MPTRNIHSRYAKSLASYKSEIVCNIYLKQAVNIIEQGIADEIDKDDFDVNFSSLKFCWKKLYPGFYDWFLTHYKKGFVE